MFPVTKDFRTVGYLDSVRKQTRRGYRGHTEIPGIKSFRIQVQRPENGVGNGGTEVGINNRTTVLRTAEGP